LYNKNLKIRKYFIFTYGMTNAGKTFTVVGNLIIYFLGKPDNPGVLPLSLKMYL
jgi:hypothetical protein